MQCLMQLSEVNDFLILSRDVSCSEQICHIFQFWLWIPSIATLWNIWFDEERPYNIL